MQTYTNPIIGGNFADPSVLRIGSDYYMTHTSYTFVPGLLIWHSRNLVDWQPIAAALHEPIGDVWAPDFIEHKGTFYIYFPANRTNWVVTAPSPHGPWSKPVDLNIKGIDPGHVVDDNGKRYLHLSDGDIVELADDGLSVIGEPRHVYDGWAYPDDWEVECFSMEGPKLTRRGDYYYLTVAEGGTAGPPTSHMVISARSKTPWGPWENSPYNPIIRTKSRSEKWWSKGHGTLVDTPDGGWYMTYHAYAAGMHTLGRQPLLEPIVWTADGWFHTAKGVTPDQPIKRPPGEQGPSGLAKQDLFEQSELGLHWQCSGYSPSQRFIAGNGLLTATGRGTLETASPLLYMPSDEAYEVEIEAALEGEVEARLLLYYNEMAHLGLSLAKEGVRHFRTFKLYGLKPCTPLDRFAGLRIRNDRNIVSFFYRADSQERWIKYDKVVDTSGFHHNTLGGFLSLRIGVDVVGTGKVLFQKFQYRSIKPSQEG